MGLYDRDYYSPQSAGMTLRAPRTIIGWLIAVNVAVFLANGLFTPETPGSLGTINGVLAVQSPDLLQPWLWWKLLTYGFVHGSIQHILFNMLALFFLGPDVERVYGPMEFLRLYLVMVVFGGLVWCATNLGFPQAVLLGASGAITGVVLLYALHFPRRTLLLFFVIPVPAWLVGVMLVVLNLFGTAGGMEDNVAYSVHLAGAAFAFVYYQMGWNFGKLTSIFSKPFSSNPFKRKPKLKIHDPEAEASMGEEVDRILAKIHRDGESSLTRRERKTLEAASRKYQQRKDR